MREAATNNVIPEELLPTTSVTVLFLTTPLLLIVKMLSVDAPLATLLKVSAPATDNVLESDAAPATDKVLDKAVAPATATADENAADPVTANVLDNDVAPVTANVPPTATLLEKVFAPAKVWAPVVTTPLAVVEASGILKV